MSVVEWVESTKTNQEKKERRNRSVGNLSRTESYIRSFLNSWVPDQISSTVGFRLFLKQNDQDANCAEQYTHQTQFIFFEQAKINPAHSNQSEPCKYDHACDCRD